MKILIAVLSYDGDSLNGNHQLIRETWGKDASPLADVRFFIGRRLPTFQPAADEILVDFQTSRKCTHEWWESYKDCCQDFWQVEARDVLRWALEHGYTHVFLCDTDTFIIPKKLVKTGFEKYDYSGNFVPDWLWMGVQSAEDIYAEKRYAWAQVGTGIFLSRKAMRLVLDSPIDHRYTDQHIAQHLGPYIKNFEVIAARLPNYVNQIAWHFRDQEGKGYQTHGAGWMKMMQEKYGEK